MLCKNNLVCYSRLHRLGSKSHVLNTTQTGRLSSRRKIGGRNDGSLFLNKFWKFKRTAEVKWFTHSWTSLRSYQHIIVNSCLFSDGDLNKSKADKNIGS